MPVRMDYADEIPKPLLERLMNLMKFGTTAPALGAVAPGMIGQAAAAIKGTPLANAVVSPYLNLLGPDRIDQYSERFGFKPKSAMGDTGLRALGVLSDVLTSSVPNRILPKSWRTPNGFTDSAYANAFLGDPDAPPVAVQPQVAPAAPAAAPDLAALIPVLAAATQEPVSGGGGAAPQGGISGAVQAAGSNPMADPDFRAQAMELLGISPESLQRPKNPLTELVGSIGLKLMASKQGEGLIGALGSAIPGALADQEAKKDLSIRRNAAIGNAALQLQKIPLEAENIRSNINLRNAQAERFRRPAVPKAAKTNPNAFMSDPWVYKQRVETAKVLADDPRFSKLSGAQKQQIVDKILFEDYLRMTPVGPGKWADDDGTVYGD